MTDLILTTPLPADASRPARIRAFLADLGLAFAAARAARARYGAF
jgi:hypothetical protein